MKKAFTLLEVIISLAVIGTVLLGLQVLLRIQLNYGDHTWRYREAIDLAASWLETRTYEQRLFTPERTGYAVEEIISSPQSGRRDVTVFVRWTDSISTNNVISLQREYYRGVNR